MQQKLLSFGFRRYWIFMILSENWKKVRSLCITTVILFLDFISYHPSASTCARQYWYKHLIPAFLGKSEYVTRACIFRSRSATTGASLSPPRSRLYLRIYPKHTPVTCPHDRNSASIHTSNTDTGNTVRFVPARKLIKIPVGKIPD